MSSALNAAWGVHFGLFTLQAFLLILFLVDKYIGWQSWVSGAVLAIGLPLAQAGVHFWSIGARRKDVDTLAKLPEWDWRG